MYEMKDVVYRKNDMKKVEKKNMINIIMDSKREVKEPSKRQTKLEKNYEKKNM